MPNDNARTGTLKLHLLEIVDVLRGLRLPYMVIGAFALPVWGRPRATLDLDFMIQTNEIPDELLAKLSDLGFHVDELWDRYNPMIRDVQKRFRMGRTPVDVLLHRDEHDAAAFSRRKKRKFDGRYIWFPSAEDLLLQKLKTGREQDLIDAAGIAERMRGKLDRKYLAKWAKKLRVTAEVAHVL